MPKTELKFEFSEDDSYDKMYRIIHCDDAFASLHEISTFLKSEIKYGEIDSEEQLDFIEKLRSKFYEIMEDNGVNLDRDYP